MGSNIVNGVETLTSSQADGLEIDENIILETGGQKHTHKLAAWNTQVFGISTTGVNKWVRLAALLGPNGRGGGLFEVFIPGSYSPTVKYLFHITSDWHEQDAQISLISGDSIGHNAFLSSVRLVSNDPTYPVPPEFSGKSSTDILWIDIFFDNAGASSGVQDVYVSALRDYNNDIVVLPQTSGIYAESPPVDPSATVVQMNLVGRSFAISNTNNNDSISSPLFYIDSTGPHWAAQTVTNSFSATITSATTTTLTSISIPASGVWMITTSGSSAIVNNNSGFSKDIIATYQLWKGGSLIAAFQHRVKRGSTDTNIVTIPLTLIHAESCAPSDTIDLVVVSSGSGFTLADYISANGQLLAVRIA